MRTEFLVSLLLTLLSLVPYSILFFQEIHFDLALFNPRSLGLLWNSTVLALTTGFMATLLASFFLIMLFFSKAKFLFFLVFIILFSLSPVVQLIVWQATPFFKLFSPFWSSVIVLSWHFFPWIILLLLLRLQHIEIAALETAQTMANFFAIAKYILFPMLFPSLIMGFFLIVLLTFMQTELPGLLGYTTYAEDFLSRIVLAEAIEDIIAAAWPFVILACFSILFIIILLKNFMAITWQQKNIFKILKIKTSIFTTIIALIILILPLVFIQIPPLDNFWQYNFSPLFNTLYLAFIAGFITMLLGYIIADSILFLNIFYRLFIIVIFFAQLFIPKTLLGLGIIQINQTLPFFQSTIIPLLFGHIIVLLPYSVLIFAVILAFNNSALIQEVKILRISWWSRQFFLQWPILLPKFFILWLFLSILAFSELTTTILLIPPGIETIILRMYNLLHYGDYQTVIALALIQTFIVLLIFSILFLIKKYD